MTMQTIPEGRPRTTVPPTSQHRPSEVVADVSSYAEASEIIDRLAGLRMPPTTLSIVAEDVRLVEDPRDGPAWLLRLGAALGAAVGTVVGILLASFTLIDPLVSGLVVAANGFIVGAAVGSLVSMGLYALTRRPRRRASCVEAERYRVMCTGERVNQARLLLQPETGIDA